MTSCNGNGECLRQCGCECYDSETDEDYEICTCGHREHMVNNYSYCPSNCCVMIECRNYKYCKEKEPKWLLDCNNGMSVACAAQMGPHKITDQIEECCVCLENKKMIMLKCNHKICNDCWYNITVINYPNNANNTNNTNNDDDETDEETKENICPMCRKVIGWCV